MAKKYRAVLHGEGEPKPQSFCPSIVNADQWAGKMLKDPTHFVMVYEIKEELVGIIVPPISKDGDIRRKQAEYFKLRGDAKFDKNYMLADAYRERLKQSGADVEAFDKERAGPMKLGASASAGVSTGVAAMPVMPVPATTKTPQCKYASGCISHTCKNLLQDSKPRICEQGQV